MAGDPGAVVFDLFHTLIDPEPLRPAGFDAITTVADVCEIDEDSLRSFWDATYVERETTPIDLVALLDRHVVSTGGELTAHRRDEVDRIFGTGMDEALRAPLTAIVDMVEQLAERAPVGVLSNCHEREVRCWPESPLAGPVEVFGRSSRIGVMKPDPAAYRWVTDRLRVDPADAVYIGNGASDELVGARTAGFGTIVHCNVFDRSGGVIDRAEQVRRARQADASVDSVAELQGALGLDQRPVRGA